MSEVQNKLVEEGEYTVLLSNYEEKPTKKGDGTRATMEFKIVNKGSEFTGRSLFLDLNVELPKSPKSEEIATQKLNEFLKATGEAPNGLESIDYDRTRMKDYMSEKVVVIVGQKESGSYTNAQGVKVASKLKNYIKKIKPM